MEKTLIHLIHYDAVRVGSLNEVNHARIEVTEIRIIDFFSEGEGARSRHYSL